MELKEFIKETLIQITEGIKEAQDATKETGVIINPDKLGIGAKGDKYIYPDGWRFTNDIEINVAVSVNEKEGHKGGIGVVTGFFSGGASVSQNNENTNVSTIKFSIPVALPVSKVSIPTDRNTATQWG